MPVGNPSGGLIASDIRLDEPNTWTGVNTFDDQVQWSIADTINTSGSELSTLVGGNYANVNIVDGTDIETFETTGHVGTVIRLHFLGSITLLHNSQLELPASDDIITEVNDEFTFVEDVSGQFRCTGYSLASGSAITGLLAVVDDPAPNLGGRLDTANNIVVFAQSPVVTSLTGGTLTVPITGNTFILDVGSSPTIDTMEFATFATPITTQEGMTFRIEIDAVATFEASSGNIDLPGNLDIVCANGDILDFAFEGATFYLTNIQRADSLSSLRDDNIPKLGGLLDANSHLIAESIASDVSSAVSPLQIATNGNYSLVTGTTTITAILDALPGTDIKLEFDDVLTLTHNATTFILPGGADIITAAGDVAEFVQIDDSPSVIWRCVNYTKVDGTPVRQTYELIAEVTASVSTNIDFISLLDASEYTYWMIEASGFNPLADDRLAVRVGDGATFHITNYSFFTTSGKAAETSNVTDTSITATLGRMGALDTALNNISNTFTMKITHNTSQNRVSITWDGYFVTPNVPVGTGARAGRMSGSVFCLNTDQTSIRFLWEGGTTFTKGDFRLYGIR